MGQSSGFTTVELLTVCVLLTAVMTIAVTVSMPMVTREATVSAVYSIQNHLQLARVEAVSRNRICRFVVDAASREYSVFDSMGTSSLLDDVVLHKDHLPVTVTFASPDGTPPVTLGSLGGGTYGTSFQSDGTVVSGVGDLMLFGGNEFRRVSLFAGGGVGLDRWTGSAWTTGS